MATPRLLLALMALMALAASLTAQIGEDGRGTPLPEFDAVLPGHWQGAVMRDGLHLPLTLDVEPLDSGWQARPSVPWWPWASFSLRPLTREPSGQITVELPQGLARMTLDRNRKELVGDVGDEGLRVHLARALRPPPARARLDEVTFPGPAGLLTGTLVRPTASGPGPWPTLVWVHGRGCGAGRRSLVRRATLLAEHGLASLVWDKRGTGGSEGDCLAATLDELASDVHAALALVGTRADLDASRTGLIGFSAGGWTALRAASTAETPPAFLISVVGPATCVESQQRANASIIGRDLGLDADEATRIDRYLDLMFDADVDPQLAYDEMTRLLASARETGWIAFHEETDIPASPEGLASLWVRRHRYDPRADLEAWRGPFLALLGGADRVVPSHHNATLYREIFAASGNDRTRVEVLPGASHGLWLDETPPLEVPGRPPGFARVAPGALERVLDFLVDEDLLDPEAAWALPTPSIPADPPTSGTPPR